MRRIVLLLAVLALTWTAVAQVVAPAPPDVPAPAPSGADDLADAPPGPPAASSEGPVEAWMESRLWSAQFGTGGTDYIYAVAAGDGGICVVGSTEGDLAEPLGGETDAYLVKFSADGVLQWRAQFGTDANEVALAAAMDDEGNCYVAGVSGGDFLGSNLGGDDTFVAKYGPDGVPIWTTMVADPADEWVHDIAVDADGACFVVTVHITDAEQDAVQICVIKIDETGAEVWRQWIGPCDRVDALSVTPDGQGGCVLAGALSGREITTLTRIALDDFGAEIARAESPLQDEMTVSGSCTDTGGNAFFAGANGGGFVIRLSADVDGPREPAQWVRRQRRRRRRRRQLLPHRQYRRGRRHLRCGLRSPRS
jgi:hypothetical protein